MDRRSFFKLLAAVSGVGLTSPAIVRADSLMRIPEGRRIAVPMSPLRVLLPVADFSMWRDRYDVIEVTSLATVDKDLWYGGLVETKASIEVLLPVAAPIPKVFFIDGKRLTYEDLVGRGDVHMSCEGPAGAGLRRLRIDMRRAEQILDTNRLFFSSAPHMFIQRFPVVEAEVL